jgi:hypothetical protein
MFSIEPLFIMDKSGYFFQFLVLTNQLSFETPLG